LDENWQSCEKYWGAPKNNTDTSHGILVFSHGENPTEFFCIVCLVPFLYYSLFSFTFLNKLFFNYHAVLKFCIVMSNSSEFVFNIHIKITTSFSNSDFLNGSKICTCLQKKSFLVFVFFNLDGRKVYAKQQCLLETLKMAN
jgi:hypothetical protein